jgi:UPF0758 protein GTNG_2548
MQKEVPYDERPREKAMKYGIQSLSNTEILAIILRTGSKEKNVLEVSQKLLYQIDKISNLKDITINELTNIKGIGKTKAITILASIELGMRIIRNDNELKTYTTPRQVFEYLYPKVKLLNKECLYALYLNTRGGLIQEVLITQGTVNSSLVDGKDIFKWALKLSATAIILVHNHPSGDPTPSIQDIKSTEKLVQMSKMMDVIILDHIIIGNDYYSMKEESKVFKVF